MKLFLGFFFILNIRGNLEKIVLFLKSHSSKPVFNHNRNESRVTLWSSASMLNNSKVIRFISVRTTQKKRDERKSERVREKRCSSLPEFDSQNIEFLQKGERMDTVVSPKNDKVRSRTTKRVVRHLFFLSLRISYKCSPLTLTARVPCRESKISPFELREIPRRRSILIDLLILRRFNSAPRASLNEDVVNAFFPGPFSIF